MEYTAVGVMGCSLGQDSLATKSYEDQVKHYQGVFAGRTTDDIVTKLHRMVKDMHGRVGRLHTKGAANVLPGEYADTVKRLMMQNAATDALYTMCANDPSAEFPALFADMSGWVEDIREWMGAIEAAQGEAQVRQAFLAKQRAAIDAINLNSIYVGPNYKRMTLNWAYGMGGNDPKAVAIREKYTATGELKEPELYAEEIAVTPAERLKFIARVREEAGVVLPEEEAARFEAAMVSAAPPEQGVPGGLIAALVAGGIAFFALRG